MLAIQTSNLTKRYKDVLAVDRLNLTVEAGEVFALLGVNGAGKTTALQMLACLRRPTDGDAVLFGKSILDASLSVKQMINLSPQETAVAPNLTVMENLRLICGIYGLDAKTARRRAEEMCGEFSLGDVAKRRARTLSGGWQRRLSIAMALISNPKLLFLDEPTLGLDVLARRELWELVRRLRGRMTIVLTTHYLEEAQALSDRIGIMVKGKLAAVGTAQELIERANAQTFEDAFVSLCGEVAL